MRHLSRHIELVFERAIRAEGKPLISLFKAHKKKKDRKGLVSFSPSHFPPLPSPPLALSFTYTPANPELES